MVSIKTLEKRKKVGFRLEEERKAKGYTQVQMIDKVHALGARFTVGHLQNMENGNRAHKVEDLDLIARILKKKLSYFLEPFL